MTRYNSKIANLYLCSSFFVLVLMGDAVHLEAVGFERTPLREGFLAQGALVRPDTCFLTNNFNRLEWMCIWLISRLHTCVRAGVSFQIKGVVEAFATEGAEVAFDVRMAFHVPIQEPLQGETLGAESAGEFGRIVGISAVDGSRGTRRRIGSAASFARLVLRPRWRIRFGSVASRVLVIVVVHQRVLDAVTAIDEF